MGDETEFLDGWRRWHEARERVALAPHGLAALVATHWLSEAPQHLDGLDGAWRIVGEDIVGDAFTIEPGGEVLLGDRLLRHMRRDDDIALRVLDPSAPTRTTLAGIDTWAPDPAWRLTGRFEPAADGATIAIDAIDGHRSDQAFAGTITTEIDGTEVRFDVTGPQTGMQLVFSDATSGTESYRFRFLTVRAEAGAGPVELDFTRAYLPPCAFADFYVCPLPPLANRLAVPVRAGEKALVRRDPAA